MQLTYPGETEGRVGSAVDEGVGNGFDNGLPRAYAERWFTTTENATAVHRWFQDELSSLGWSEVTAKSTFRVYGRNADERIGVATFGGNVRVHFEVEGRWPDGTTGYRPT